VVRLDGCAYDEIQASVDGSIPTEFLLDSPAIVRTGQEYSIVVKIDGGENFILWQNIAGQTLVGTTRISPGPSSKYVGPLYQYVNAPGSQTPTGYGYTNNSIVSATSNNAALLYTSSGQLGMNNVDAAYLSNNWNPVPNSTLKFRVYVAKFSHAGQPVIANSSISTNNALTSAHDRAMLSSSNASVISNNVVSLLAQVEAQEYILFDRNSSTRNELLYGEPVFQYAPQWPGGVSQGLTITCAPTVTSVNTGYASRLVQANGSFVLANGLSFANSGGFNNVVAPGSTFVVRTANGEFEIRYVAEIVSNTSLLVDAPFSNTFANATFSIAPLGFVNDVSPSNMFGRKADILVLYDTTANSSVRFVSDAVFSIGITANGTGYSNSDYVKITGFEQVTNAVEGNYAAYANVVTNGNGSLTAIYMSNCGAGFSNTSWLAGANVRILQSNTTVASNTASASGTGANLSIVVNSKLLSAFSNTIFSNCDVINLEAVRMKPEITVNNPVGTAFTIRHRTLYYKVKDANTLSGYATYMNTPTEAERTDTYAKIFKGHDLIASGSNRVPVIPSRSNQFVTRFANGAIPTANDYGDYFSNSAVFIFDISSNNDYQAVYFDPEIVNSHYARYIINRDYTNEHTNFGSAWAKHLATKVNFQEDRYAEDLLLYLTAYKPVDADIKVYAKLHNSHDPEEFDDKEWTLLELIDGIGVHSSSVDTSDYIELTYNLPSYPNSEFTCNGSVTLYQGNAFVTGTNTFFGPIVTINAGGTGYSNSDTLYFTAVTDSIPSEGAYALDLAYAARGTVTTNTTGGITAVTIANTGKNWVSQANVTAITVANSTGGTSAGSGANVYYRPGLAANDLIKIYSPLFPETNYVVAVVNSIVSNTSLTVKRAFGDLAANGTGTVAVNNSVATITGTGTSFTTDFTVGDFVAVWANSSSYEVRPIASITNATSMSIVSNTLFTITVSGTPYAYVEPDIFVNNSISVSGMKVDRLHYVGQAYNNILNDNVSRYYSSTFVPYDGFDTFQVKVVMLSNNDINVPKLDDERGLGVTA
jgi:hypothetical protein